jgi:hypothetical protein
MSDLNNEKLEKLNQKIEVLRKKRDKIVAIESNKHRKLLVKQKILVGGYVLNSLDTKPLQEQIEFLKKVKKTIDEKRKSDCYAIQNLIDQKNNL